MASLDILCSNPLNVKNKITKREHILWSIKKFEKYFIAHQYMPKILHDPTKTLRPTPTYLMFGPLLMKK